MGCPKEIAEWIRSRKGDYVLAVKRNQGTLHEEILEAFELDEHEDCGKLKAAYHEEMDSGHGRIEVRRV